MFVLETTFLSRHTDHTAAPARWHDEAAEAAKPHDLALIPIERHTIRVDMTAIKSTKARSGDAWDFRSISI